MPPVATRTNVSLHLRNLWSVVSGRRLRQDIRGYLSRKLPSLRAVQAALPGMPNNFLPGVHIEPVGSNVMQMSAAQPPNTPPTQPPATGRPTAPPTAPPQTQRPSAPPPPARGSRLRTGLYFAGAALASAAAVIFPATNLLSWGLTWFASPTLLLKVSAGAALGASAGLNIAAGLLLAFIGRRLYRAVRGLNKAPVQLRVAAQSPEQQTETQEAANRILMIEARPRLDGSIASLVEGYQDLAELKTILGNGKLRLESESRNFAEVRIAELAEDIRSVSPTLNLLIETKDGQEYLIVPAEQQKAGIDPSKITTMPNYALCLGIGGVGEVFLAVAAESLANPSDLSAPITKVAAKVIMPETDASIQADLRVRLEGKVAAIQHPNVIKVVGYGETFTGRAFILLEYIEHQTLREVYNEYRDRGDKIGVDKVIGWMTQIISAMAASHKADIFHRDLKLENVFKTEETRSRQKQASDLMVVTDFGMAKVTSENIEQSLQDVTTAGQIPGTLSYLPPEATILQHVSRSLNDIEKNRWNAKWDIYALGNIFYRLLTLEAPVKITSGGEYWQYSLGVVSRADQSNLAKPEGTPGRVTVAELLRFQIEQKDAADYALPQRPGNIPEPLWEIITKMLAYNPLDRYDSCQEILSDLAAYSAGRPTKAPVSAEGPTSLSQAPQPPSDPDATRATRRQVEVLPPAEELDFGSVAPPEPLPPAAPETGLQQMLTRLNGPEQEQFIRRIVGFEELDALDLRGIESARLERALGTVSLELLEAAAQTADQAEIQRVNQLYDLTEQAIALIRATREEKS